MRLGLGGTRLGLELAAVGSQVSLVAVPGASPGLLRGRSGGCLEGAPAEIGAARVFGASSVHYAGMPRRLAGATQMPGDF